MSSTTGHGVVTMVWAGDIHTFRLDYGAILQLQEKTDKGPQEILFRIQTGSWRAQEISETIRCGLIGGGMEPNSAFRTVQIHVKERPLLQSLPIAEIILKASLMSPDPIDLTQKVDDESGELTVTTENVSSENSTST